MFPLFHLPFVSHSAFLLLLLLVSNSSALNPSEHAVHFDIEPHGLPEWTTSATSKASIANQWLVLLSSMGLLAHSGNVRLTMDTAMEYTQYSLVDTSTNINNLLAWHVYQRVDNCLLMDYRDHDGSLACYPGRSLSQCPDSDSILSHATEALQISDSFLPPSSSLAPKYSDSAARSPYYSAWGAGDNRPLKLLSIAVEVNLISDAPKISFYEEKEGFMNYALNQTNYYFKNRFASYGGLAVHDLTGYINTNFIESTPFSGTVPSVLAPCRSIFVWNTDYIAGKNGKTGNQLISFGKSHFIHEFIIESQDFLYDLTNTGAVNQLKSFILLARDNGMKVQILFGDHTWSYTANHYMPIRLLNNTINFFRTLPSPLYTIKPTHCVPLYIADDGNANNGGGSSSSGGSTGIAGGSTGGKLGGSTGIDSSASPSTDGRNHPLVFLIVSCISFLVTKYF